MVAGRITQTILRVSSIARKAAQAFAGVHGRVVAAVARLSPRGQTFVRVGNQVVGDTAASVFAEGVVRGENANYLSAFAGGFVGAGTTAGVLSIFGRRADALIPNVVAGGAGGFTGSVASGAVTGNLNAQDLLVGTLFGSGGGAVGAGGGSRTPTGNAPTTSGGGAPGASSPAGGSASPGGGADFPPSNFGDSPSGPTGVGDAPSSPAGGGGDAPSSPAGGGGDAPSSPAGGGDAPTSPASSTTPASNPVPPSSVAPPADVELDLRPRPQSGGGDVDAPTSTPDAPTSPDAPASPDAPTSPDGSSPDGSTPDGSTPDGSTPDGSTPDGPISDIDTGSPLATGPDAAGPADPATAPAEAATTPDAPSGSDGPNLPVREITLKPKPEWNAEQLADFHRKVDLLNENPGTRTAVPAEARQFDARRFYEQLHDTTVPSNQHVDHALELQLGGAYNDPSNLTPLDASVNMSVGSQIRHAIKGDDFGQFLYRFVAG